MEFPRQEQQSRKQFPPPEELLDSGIEPTSPATSALAGRFFITESNLSLKLCNHLFKKVTPRILWIYQYNFIFLMKGAMTKSN